MRQRMVTDSWYSTNNWLTVGNVEQTSALCAIKQVWSGFGHSVSRRSLPRVLRLCAYNLTSIKNVNEEFSTNSSMIYIMIH